MKLDQLLSEDSIQPRMAGRGKWTKLRGIGLTNGQLREFIKKEVDPEVDKVEWGFRTDDAVAKVHYYRRNGDKMVVQLFFTPWDSGSGSLGFNVYYSVITFDEYKKVYR